jgi:uncharacterized iron-regulated membrane protein
MRRLRSLHRASGLVLAAFLISTATTGLIWALSSHIYWTKDYLKPKQKVEAIDVATIRVHPADAATSALRASKKGDEVMSVTLRRDGGRTLYDVAIRAGKNSQNILIDATDGTLLSPISEEFAGRLARQYVRDKESVISSIRLEPRWISRRNDAPRPAFLVSFSRPAKTEIVLDTDSGRILEESDPTRRFHFFVTRLHRLDFFGTDKLLTLVPGLGILTMTISGLAIYRRRRLAIARH